MIGTIRKWDLSQFPVARIRTARENDYIYDRFGIANVDDAALTISISEKGIQEPLTLSEDYVLLSGHRRLSAAKHLGMKTVPVRLSEVVYDDLSKQDRLETLRLHNRQREKSSGERIRERLVDIEPAMAHSTLMLRRVKALTMQGSSTINVELGCVKTRARITTLEFLTAVQNVVNENRLYWPLTDRRIHYLLSPCVRLVVASPFTRMIRAGATQHAEESTFTRVHRAGTGQGPYAWFAHLGIGCH